MSKDIALDPETGDLLLTEENGGKTISLVSGADALAQRLRLRLGLFRGSWFLDTSVGVPWIQSLLGKGISTQTVESVIREVIATCPGVASITFLEVTADTTERTVAISFAVLSTEGEPVEIEDYVFGESA